MKTAGLGKDGRRESTPDHGGSPRLVTVVIPAFNAERTIGPSVASVVEQPGLDRVLVVEDGSSDATLAVCRRLEESHDRVVVLRHADGANRGPAASRNLGIAAATSAYVSFLDADDVALDDRFGPPLAILEARPEVDGVYEAVGRLESEAVEVDSDASRRLPLMTLAEPVAPERFFETLLAPGTGTVHTNGFVIRRGVFERIGGFVSDFEPAEDMHLFWRLAAACTMAPGRLDRPVAVYRRHSGSLSVPSDPVYLEDPFRRALDLCRWARGRRDVSAANRRLLKRILVHNIAAWWGGPIGKVRLRAVQVRRLMRAVPVAPSVLVAPKIWLGALGLKPEPKILGDRPPEPRP